MKRMSGKKVVAWFFGLFVLFGQFPAPSVFASGQVEGAGEGGSGVLLNVKTYFSYFPAGKNETVSNNDYVWSSESEDYDRFSVLGGDNEAIDTPLEFALLSYYSQPVINIRPVQANTMLPANNPKQADLKLGAALIQEIQILRFLGDTAAVGRHETVLKFITDRGNATSAEIETYYRNGIRGLVSEIVDEEFGRVSFPLRNLSADRTYDSILTRNAQTGQYTLSYERPSIQNSKKELSATSLEALSSVMSGNADFVRDDINQVRAQAALIPAVALSDAALNEAKNILTNFYINPSPASYGLLKDWYVVYSYAIVNSNNERHRHLQISSQATLSALNDALKQKVVSDTNRQIRPAVLDRTQTDKLVELRR